MVDREFSVDTPMAEITVATVWPKVEELLQEVAARRSHGSPAS